MARVHRYSLPAPLNGRSHELVVIKLHEQICIMPIALLAIIILQCLHEIRQVGTEHIVKTSYHVLKVLSAHFTNDAIRAASGSFLALLTELRFACIVNLLFGKTSMAHLGAFGAGGFVMVVDLCSVHE